MEKPRLEYLPRPYQGDRKPQRAARFVSPGWIVRICDSRNLEHSRHFVLLRNETDQALLTISRGRDLSQWA